VAVGAIVGASVSVGGSSVGVSVGAGGGLVRVAASVGETLVCMSISPDCPEEQADKIERQKQTHMNGIEPSFLTI